MKLAKKLNIIGSILFVIGFIAVVTGYFTGKNPSGIFLLSSGTGLIFISLILAIAALIKDVGKHRRKNNRRGKKAPRPPRRPMTLITEMEGYEKRSPEASQPTESYENAPLIDIQYQTYTIGEKPNKRKKHRK